MEKSDDITAPSAQSPQIPQDNVLHSPLGIRLDEALSSVSDWTEEMGLQMEGFPKNCQVLPPLPPRALFRVHRAGRSGICFKLLMPDYINCYQGFFGALKSAKPTFEKHKINKKAKLDWEMLKFSKCGCMLIPEMKFSLKTRPHIPYSTTPLLYLLLGVPENAPKWQLSAEIGQFSTGHQRDLQNCNLSRKFLLIWFRWHGNQRSVTLSPRRDANLINFVVMFPLYCLKNCFWTLKLGNFTLNS